MTIKLRHRIATALALLLSLIEISAGSDAGQIRCLYIFTVQ